MSVPGGGRTTPGRIGTPIVGNARPGGKGISQPEARSPACLQFAISAQNGYYSGTSPTESGNPAVDTA